VRFRLIATFERRPWWGFGLVARVTEYTFRSQPGVSREYVEDFRRRTLARE
jgi:hypothetical protein